MVQQRTLASFDESIAYEEDVPGMVGVSVAPDYKTFKKWDDVEGATIPASVNALLVNGRASHGDCGAVMILRRVLSEPTHTLWTTSNDGTVYWALANDDWTPEMAEAPVDGVNDDAPAINAVLAGRGRAKLSNVYHLATKVRLARNQALQGPGAEADCIKLTHADAGVIAGDEASGFGANLSGLRIDGQDIADTCMEFGSQLTSQSTLRDVRLMNFKKRGLKIGQDSDQLVLDRIEIGPARAADPDSYAMHQVGPGPFYATNVVLAAGAGGGLFCSSHGTLVNARINFFVNGLVRFQPPTPANNLNMVGPFLENTGFAHAEDGVPAGSPVGVICDGVDDPTAGPSGWINIEAPQKVQGGWPARMFEATRGGRISIDCRMPWQGASGNRDLEALRVATPDSGSQIVLRGPWDFTDWTKVTTLGRLSPQSWAPPLVADTKTLLWEADLTSTALWGAPSSVANFRPTADGRSLEWDCDGTAASIAFDIPEDVTARAVGRPLLLVAETTHTGSGALFLNARFTPSPVGGATISKASSSQSWDASVYGWGKRVHHGKLSMLAGAGRIRAEVGHDSGLVGSDGRIQVHCMRLYALGVQSCL